MSQEILLEILQGKIFHVYEMYLHQITCFKEMLILKACSHQTTPVTITITNVTLTAKMGIQPIIVPVKKIKGAARQCNVNRVVRYEQSIKLPVTIVKGKCVVPEDTFKKDK